jgi:hypothetical protein
LLIENSIVYSSKEMREKMITDVTNPKFNIASIPPMQRTVPMYQLVRAREGGLITQDEFLDIACNQWYIQVKASKVK